MSDKKSLFKWYVVRAVSGQENKIKAYIENEISHMGMDSFIEELRADKKKFIEELKQTIEATNPEALLADGLDDALAGYDTQGRAIYFVDKIIGTLMERDGMTYEEAYEFFDFNIAGAYVGEYTPIYMYEE